MELVQSLAQALEHSGFGAWARQSSYAYPMANLIHLLGLVLLVGGIGLLDLRIAGLFRSLPLAAMSRILTPFAIVGLMLMIISGFTMFAADAGPLSKSKTFGWKLSLIALSLANAVAFRLLWRRQMEGPGLDVPLLGRIMAAASVGLWLWIAALGRLIAYT